MSTKLTEKTTIYLTPVVKRFLQLRSLQQSQTMSRIIDDRFSELLKDFEEQKDKAWKQHDEKKEWEWTKSHTE